MTWADNMQRVRRANFSAAWEEIGPDNHLEETYALHTENIPGEANFAAFACGCGIIL